MLALTPAERLRANDRMIRTVEELRHGFSTSLGQLDVLGAIEGGREYPDLVRQSVEIEVEGEVVRVLGLRTLAELKRGATDAKGRLALAVLEATLKRSGGG